MEQALRNFLTNRTTLTTWIILVLISLAVMGWDLHRKNSHLMPLMKLVWILTLAYSGPLGLAIYYYAGRRQIRRDSLWRRAFRSTAHCYSGCGAGEIMGVVFAAGIFGFGNRGIAIITLRESSHR